MEKLLQILISPKKANRHPFEVAFIGFFYASLSLVFSIWVFPEYSSIVMVFLTVISCLYIVQGSLIIEEVKQNRDKKEEWILREHSKLIILLVSLFLGYLLAFVSWSIILPKETAITAFSMQSDIIESIKNSRDSITANVINPTDFSIIILNNLRVLLFSFVFALFYGAGSLFILVWNASILGFLIGSLAKHTLGLTSLPLLFTKYLIHGIPEMLAYFIASLVGGIIFIKIVRNDFNNSNMKRTLFDLGILIVISLLILVLAALIETFVTPFI